MRMRTQVCSRQGMYLPENPGVNNKGTLVRRFKIAFHGHSNIYLFQAAVFYPCGFFVALRSFRAIIGHKIYRDIQICDPKEERLWMPNMTWKYIRSTIMYATASCLRIKLPKKGPRRNAGASFLRACHTVSENTL